MSDMPEKIWAWEYMASRQDDVMQGGWTRHEESREIEYVRTDRLERIALAAKDLADAVSRTGYATDNAGNTRLLDKDAMDSINDALKAFREATQ